ncbi:Uncharacterised protein [uncultured archaeon]|nr:Uncharacterised protein [uncultured archaeon]
MQDRKGFSAEIIFYFVLAIFVAALVLIWVIGKFNTSGLL